MRLTILLLIYCMYVSCSQKDTMKVESKMAPLLFSIKPDNKSTLGLFCKDNKKTLQKIQTPEMIEKIYPEHYYLHYSDNENMKVKIIFRKPLLSPLTTRLDKKRADLLKHFCIEPDIGGEFSFSDNSTVVFIPKNALPYATRFTVIIRKGLKDNDGKILKKDFSWQFTTRLPEITIKPSKRDNFLCSLDETFEIKSNLKLDLNTLKKCTRIVEEGTDCSLPYDLYEHDRNLNAKDDPFSQKHSYFIKPLEPLQKNKRYSIIIIPGVTTAHGNIPTEKNYTFRFKTYPDFEFIGIDHIPNDNWGTHLTYTPLFVFSNPLQLDNNSNPWISVLSNDKTDTSLCRFSAYDINCVDTLFYYSCSKITKGSSRYLIKLSPELTDQAGQIVINSGFYEFSTTPHSPFLSCPVRYKMLPPGKLSILPIKYSNLDGVYYKIHKMEQMDLFLIWKKIKDHSDRSVCNLFNKYDHCKNIDTISKFKKLKLNDSSIDSSFINLKKHLYRGKFGILTYKVFSPAIFDRNNKIIKFAGMVQYTNIGMHIQLYPSCGLIKLNKLTNNKPVAGAHVKIYKWSEIDSSYLYKQNEPFVQGKTDKDGLFYYHIDDEEDSKKICKKLNRNDHEFLVIAEKNGDLTYCFSNDKMRSFRSCHNNNMFLWNGNEREYKAAVFSDQKLYNSGDTVMLKGVVRFYRYGNIYMPTGDELIKVVVLDNNWQKKYDTTFYNFNNEGFGTFACKIPTNKWKYGKYEVCVDVDFDTVKSGPAQYLGTVKLGPVQFIDMVKSGPVQIVSSFEISEFRVPEFSVSFSNNNNVIVTNSEFDLTYSCKFYDGNPIKDVTSYLKIKKYKTCFKLKEWDNYQFQYPRYGYGLIDSTTKTIRMNDNGTATASINAKSTIPVRYDLDVEITGFNGQASAARKSILVLPDDTLIGIALEQKTLSNGDSIYLNVIVTDTGGIPLKNIPIEITFYQRIQINQDNDTTLSLHQKKIISDSIPVRTGIFCKYGNYNVQVETRNKKQYVQKYFSVEEQIGNPYKNKKLKIELDKKKYHDGDTVNAIIASPFQNASVLISVSNNKIFNFKCLNVKNGICKYSFVVNKDMQPAAFIIVSAFNNVKTPLKNFKNDDAWGEGMVKKGIQRFDVYTENKHLDMKIAVSHKVATPKSHIDVDVNVYRSDNEKGHKSELTVMVIDDAILSLSGYKLQGLFDVFKKKPHYSAIINDNRQIESCRRGSLTRAAPVQEERIGDVIYSDQVRKNFRKLAYYNATLITDKAGNAKFNFTLPDNCTTWKIIAVATGENNLFGYGEENIVVKQPLTIRPVMPRFARYGDLFSGGFSVTNGSEEDVIVNTVAEISSGDVLSILNDENNQRTLKLKTGETKINLFPFEAASNGTIMCTFTGTSKRKKTSGSRVSDAMSIPFTIHPISPSEILSCAGEIIDSVSWRINVPHGIRKDIGGIDIEVSNTMLTAIKEPLEYLVKYPYGCLEQTISRLIPLMHIRYFAENKPSSIKLSSTALKDTIEKNLKKVLLLQHKDGGFKYWKNNDFSEPGLSADVAFLYKLCKQYGYPFPIDTGKLTEYLVDYMPSRFYDEKKINSKSIERALFYLTGKSNIAKLDDFEKNQLLNICHYKDSLPIPARLRLLNLLNKSYYRKKALFELNELCNKITVKDNIACFDNNQLWNSIPANRSFYNSETLNEADLVNLLLEMKPKSILVPKLVRYLITKMNNEGRWNNTYETSAALGAIASYCKKYEADTSAYTLLATVNGDSFFNCLSEADNNRPVTIHIPFRDLKDGQNDIAIFKDSENYLHYSIKYSYYMKKSPEPIRNRGFTINKKIYHFNDRVALAEYYNNSPDTLNLSSGKVYKIELEYSADSSFSEVVIDDPIPAGMEIINTTFANVSSQYATNKKSDHDWCNNDPITYEELKDDRVALFLRNMAPGKYRYVYYIRAVTNGVFFWPRASISPMYNTELTGTTSEGYVKIQ